MFYLYLVVSFVIFGNCHYSSFDVIYLTSNQCKILECKIVFSFCLSIWKMAGFNYLWHTDGRTWLRNPERYSPILYILRHYIPPVRKGHFDSFVKCAKIKAANKKVLRRVDALTVHTVQSAPLYVCATSVVIGLCKILLCAVRYCCLKDKYSLCLVAGR